MQRNDAWNALLELSRHARYYDVMARRYRRRWIATRLLLACSALGPIAVVLDAVSLTDPEKALAAALILIVVAADLVLDFGKTAAVLDTIRKDLAMLEREGRDVWESGEHLERMAPIQHRMIDVSHRTEISLDDRLNQKCTTQSYSVEAARYAA